MVPVLVLLALAAGPSDAGPPPGWWHWPSRPTPLYAVQRFCEQQPDQLGSWFPPNHLKVPFPKSAPEDGGAVGVDRVASSRCYAGAILGSYKEPVLAQGSLDETYRVIWQPSFSPPVVIRVQRLSDGGYRAWTKRDLSKGEELTGYFSTYSDGVTSSDFEVVRAAAERAGCWATGNTCHAESSDRSGWIIADGESWLLEGSSQGEHWAVQIHHPKEGTPFMDVCEAIVKAAQSEARLTVGGHIREWRPNAIPDGGL